MNLFSKKILFDKPRILIDTSTPGAYVIATPAGRYEFVLIGAGGGAVGGQHDYSKSWTQGGVGGSIIAIINIYLDTSLQVLIGAGGESRYSFTPGNFNLTADNGGKSEITGISGVTNFLAGGGRGANGSSSGAVIVQNVGIQGQNNIAGDSIVQITNNNNNIILSQKGISTATSRIGDELRAKNTNWPLDPKIGSSGDIGWGNPNTIHRLPGINGYCRIRRI